MAARNPYYLPTDTENNFPQLSKTWLFPLVAFLICGLVIASLLLVTNRLFPKKNRTPVENTSVDTTQEPIFAHEIQGLQKNIKDKQGIFITFYQGRVIAKKADSLIIGNEKENVNLKINPNVDEFQKRNGTTGNYEKTDYSRINVNDIILVKQLLGKNIIYNVFPKN